MNYTATKEEISAELKRLNKLQKEAPREFNRGHFPKGTVALFESPTAGWVKEEDRLFPEQRYELVEETVLSVTSNGPRSYIATLDRLSEHFEGQLSHTNIAWCRKIIKRGEGSVSTRVKSDYEILTQRDLHPYDTETRRSYNKHHSKYNIVLLREFILGMLSEDARYNGDNGDHYYDLTKIVKLVVADPAMLAAETQGQYFSRWLINKKKFHRILRNAVVRSKCSRRIEQAISNVIDQKMYMDDLVDRDDELDELPVDEDQPVKDHIEADDLAEGEWEAQNEMRSWATVTYDPLGK